MIIINTKNYKTGNELVKLAKLVEDSKVKAIMAVPATDIIAIVQNTKLSVYAQHVDATSETSTGWLSASNVKKHGAKGTLLNHSEHSMPFDMLKATVQQCKKLGLETVVCAESLAMAQKILKLKPNAIAFEDPALIGTGKSITSYRTHDLQKFVKMLKGRNVLPICGAGISSIDDVKAAYWFGCKGVLIASAIAKSKNPSNLINSLKEIQ